MHVSVHNIEPTQISLHFRMMIVLLFLHLLIFQLQFLGPLGSGGGCRAGIAGRPPFPPGPLPAFPLLFFGLTAAVHCCDLRGRLEAVWRPSPSGDQLEGQAAEQDGAAAGTPGLGLGLEAAEHGLGFDLVDLVEVVLTAGGLSLHVVRIRYFALHLKERSVVFTYVCVRVCVWVWQLGNMWPVLRRL